jgi:hypothetical protein
MLSIFELQLEAALIFSLSESAAGFGRQSAAACQ